MIRFLLVVILLLVGIADGVSALRPDLVRSEGHEPSAQTVESWLPVSMTGAPRARWGATGVWTGNALLVWGGQTRTAVANDGGRYDPATDTWTPITSFGAPSPRYYAVSFWTGTEMLVWGGQGCLQMCGDGGAYNPITDTWRPLSVDGAPGGRSGYVATWTGTEMLIWGGTAPHEPILGPPVPSVEGARYSPTTNSWSPISTIDAPTRRGERRAVWTGTEMLVTDANTRVGSNEHMEAGGRYNPRTDTWNAMAPCPDRAHCSGEYAVWTGTEMLVWGFRGGMAYDPETDTWTSMSLVGAPKLRAYPTVLWTELEMVVWGGIDRASPPGYPLLNTGLRFDPVDDVWRPVTTVHAPAPRVEHVAVWTGSEMIIWGGLEKPPLGVTESGGRYRPPAPAS